MSKKKTKKTVTKKPTFKGLVLETAGNGMWSREERQVKLTGADAEESHFSTDEECYGELRLYFGKRSWNVEKHGLIYTDRLFERQLNVFLKKNGIDPKTVGYSEQGMQGDDYVSLDFSTKATLLSLQKLGA